MKKNKRVIGFLIVGIVIAISFGVILYIHLILPRLGEGKAAQESETKESNKLHADSVLDGSKIESSLEDSLESIDPNESYPFYHSDEETFSIETPYAELRYPIRWQGYLTTDFKDGHILFSTPTLSGVVKLFELRFGVGDGYLLGYLEGEDGALPVYIETFSFGDDLLLEELERCCEMSEDVNVIIFHLIDEYGFRMGQTDGPNESKEESFDELENEPLEEAGEELGLLEIITPFAVLKYPARWRDVLLLSQTSEEPYALLFSCGPIKLFTLTFCEEEGFYLGSFSSGGASVPLYITSYSLDAEILSSRDYEQCCNMSEDVNILLEQLRYDYGLHFGDEPEESVCDEGVFEIVTRFVKLKYPSCYEQYLVIHTTDGTPLKLSFFAKTSIGEVGLFDLLFDGGEGYLLGSLNVEGRRVPLRIVSYELPQNALAPEEFVLCCAMEEEVNTILDYLKMDYAFSFEKEDFDTIDEFHADEETFQIETRFTDLHYPMVWQDFLTVNIRELGVYTVSFLAKTTVGDVILFDLTFDGGEGYLLGMLPYNNKNIELRIVSYDFDITRLSAEEYERCCAMSEDVNVIISGLAEKSGLEF